MAPSTQHVTQHEGVQPQDGARRFDVTDRPLQFEVIPLVCLVEDICHFLQISRSQFKRLMALRQLALVELEPFDRKRRFTGESLAFEIKRRSQPKLRAVGRRR